MCTNPHRLLLAILLSILCHSAYADSLESLLSLSLEELMNIKVSVNNRGGEDLQHSAAAITVITQQRIKNSGIRSIPELMRLVPGFHVKRIDGNKWEISSRRIGNRFSNSMLVLMDGRTLYNPLFAGTFWDTQDTLIEDIEHIEVIRGPGSVAWGANAITGVINIVTKNAAETQDHLLYAGAGRGEINYDTAARGGYALANGYLRLYGKNRKTDEGRYLHKEGSNLPATFLANNPKADDGTQSVQIGFRYDLTHDNTTHTLQGDGYDADSNDIRRPSEDNNKTDAKGYNLLYRLQSSLSSIGRVELTAYYDYTERFSSVFHDKREIVNLESIYHHDIHEHVISVGASYRYVEDDTAQQLFPFGFNLQPASRRDDLYSIFLQDHWEASENKLWLTAGVRAEKNDYSGIEYNPSLRGSINLDENITLWAAISRSVRTPSRSETDAYIGSSIFIGSLSNDSVTTDSYELGYRHLLSSTLNIELAAFYDYESNPLDDGSGNTVRHANFNGIEAEFNYQASPIWQLMGSITYFNARPDSNSINDADDAETWSGQLSSHYQMNNDLKWNILAFLNEGQYDYSSLERIDTNLIWQVNENLDLQFSVNNIFDSYHYEAGDPTRMNSAIRRGGLILATLQF